MTLYETIVPLLKSEPRTEHWDDERTRKAIIDFMVRGPTAGGLDANLVWHAISNELWRTMPGRTVS